MRATKSVLCNGKISGFLTLSFHRINVMAIILVQTCYKLGNLSLELPATLQ
jgi:hypothetical protein